MPVIDPLGSAPPLSPPAVLDPAREPRGAPRAGGRSRLAPWERLVDLVAAPSTAFRALAESPVAWVPLAVATLLELARVYAVYAPARTPAAVVVTAMLQLLVVVVPVIVLAAALRLALATVRGVPFVRVFAVVAHAAIAYHLVAFVAAVGAAAVGLDPPAASGHHEANLGWLADPAVEPLRHRLLSALDLGRAWQLVLTAIGLHVALPGVGRARAAGAVGAVWGGYLLVTSAVKLAVA